MCIGTCGCVACQCSDIRHVPKAQGILRVQYQDTEDVIAESAKQAQTRRRAERVDSVLSEAWSRGKWLLGLLVLQSMSSIVLDSYQDLLRDHLVITLFLTMLVGAGGNAGNQSAIKVCALGVAPACALTRLLRMRLIARTRNPWR